MEIICIYPFDESTNFLMPIYKYLENTDGFKGLRISENGDNINSCYELIQSCSSNAIIVFLGHGCSHCLYYGNKQSLIDKDKFNIFSSKRIFLLSCRSSDFIENQKPDQVNSYIGFGDLLTDWTEVLSERESNSFAYKDMSEDIISLFKDFLVRSILESFSNFILFNKDFQYLHLQIKLRFNRKFCGLLRDKNDVKSNRIYANLLFESKNEIVFK